MTGKVPVRMQVAWFVLQCALHSAPTHFALHRPNRSEHVSAATGNVVAMIMADTNRSDFIRRPSSENRGAVISYTSAERDGGPRKLTPRGAESLIDRAAPGCCKLREGSAFYVQPDSADDPARVTLYYVAAHAMLR